MSMPLTSMEGFVFSRLDGVLTMEELCAAVSQTQEEVSEILNKLCDLGAVDVLVVSDEVDEPVKESAKTSAATDNEGDISPEVRQRIMGMKLRLEQANFYQMLGVPPDADRAKIRGAYFSLSKEFHPDSYYGKDLGRYTVMIEAIFARLTEAYETLSRKKRRDRYDEYIVDQIRAWEMERSLAGDVAVDQSGSMPNMASGEAAALEPFVFTTTPAGQAPEPLVSPDWKPEGPSAIGMGDAGVESIPDAPAEPPPQAPTRPRPAPVAPPRPPAGVTSPPAAPSTAKSPEPKRTSTLGPASDRIKRMRQRRGKDAVRALLSGARASAPRVRQQNQPQQFKVDIDIVEPGPAQTVEEGLSYRYRAAGVEALRLNDLSAALNAFEVAATLDPHDEKLAAALAEVRDRAQGALAKTYERQGRYEEEAGKFGQAANSFLKALQHKEDDHSLMLRAAVNLLRGDLDLKKARGLARRAVGMQPDNADYRLTLAEIYLKVGSQDLAEEELQAAQRLEPNNDRVARLRQAIGREG